MSVGAEDAEFWQAETLRVVVIREGDEVTVVVDGRLDRSGAERFRSCVMEALGNRPAVLAVDAGALTSVDSPGMAGLLRVRHAVIDAGGGVPGQRRFMRPSARSRGRWLRGAASRRVTRREPGTPARHRPRSRIPGSSGTAQRRTEPFLWRSRWPLRP
jgi:ABC-type transporter Mla MlaB component